MKRSLLFLVFALLIACSDHKPQEKVISSDSLSFKKDSIFAVENTPVLSQRAAEQDSNSIERKLSTEDDIQIESYLKELNADFIEAQNENASYSDGDVHYSPDSLFKIYVLEGEAIGTSMWSSYLHFNNGNHTIKEAVDFSSIDTIYRLPKDDGILRYLVMQRSHGKASGWGAQSFSASILAIEKDSIILQPFIVDGVKEDASTFSINQLDGTEYDMSLRYDPSSATLKYQHVRNYLSCCQVDADSLRKGTLRYAKGAFRSVAKSIKHFQHQDPDQ